MNTELKTLIHNARQFLTADEICQQQWLLGLVEDSLLEYDELRRDYYELPNSKIIVAFCKACLIRNVFDDSFTASKMTALWRSVGIVYHAELFSDCATLSPAYVTLDHRRLFRSGGYMDLLTCDLLNDLEEMLRDYILQCEIKAEEEELPF